MTRGVEREGERIRVRGILNGDDLDWREAESLGLSLLQHAKQARERELTRLVAEAREGATA